MKRIHFWLAFGALAAAAYWWWPSELLVGTRTIGEWEARLNDLDPGVRSEAVQSLEEMGPRAAVLLPYLHIAARDQHPVVRARAIAALAAVGRSEAELRILVEALDDESPSVRMNVVMALPRYGKGAVPALIRALQDPHPTVRSDAAFGLSQLGPEAQAAVPALMVLKEHRNRRLAQAARKALDVIQKGAPPQ
jgi:HEAT repeat protein